jgi:hypothetical protein
MLLEARLIWATGCLLGNSHGVHVVNKKCNQGHLASTGQQCFYLIDHDIVRLGAGMMPLACQIGFSFGFSCAQMFAFPSAAVLSKMA